MSVNRGPRGQGRRSTPMHGRALGSKRPRPPSRCDIACSVRACTLTSRSAEEPVPLGTVHA
eukprot:313664-Chlamydomonas_euryale.AAC.3